jgi:sec-independent protein translocase protein TatA
MNQIIFKLQYVYSIEMTVGPTEFLLIFGAILLLFGPSKLPEIARSLGKATQQYRKGITDVKDGIESDLDGATKPLTEDEHLIRTAQKLDIPTEGRSIEDIAQDILNKTE